MGFIGNLTQRRKGAKKRVYVFFAPLRLCVRCFLQATLNTVVTSLFTEQIAHVAEDVVGLPLVAGVELGEFPVGRDERGL